MPQNVRDVAVTALMRWESEKTYSNIMLDRLLHTAALKREDKAFVTRLVYGVIERLLTLDWLLGKNSRQPIKKCHPAVRAILRTACYQLVFMEKIPQSAAVNEAVAQTKRFRQPYASGFVNGVLRSVAQKKEQLMSGLPFDKKGMSIRCSVPVELLESWISDYGLDTAYSLAKAANDTPPGTVRVNTLATTVSEFKEALLREQIPFTETEGLPQALSLNEAALLASAIPDTQYYFQDAASQWAVAALAPKAGERVIDVCAAPGGKSLTAAQYMNNCGEIVSCDIYDEKVKTMKSRAAHYDATMIHALKRDASHSCRPDESACFDRVICDVPCSGLGVIRRRPEIRYKSLSSFSSLADLQYSILCASAQLVKKGGVLQYSTCTLRKEENEQIAERFLNEHPDFLPRPLPTPLLFEKAGLPPSHMITLLPFVHGTDGFFMASFQKGECL